MKENLAEYVDRVMREDNLSGGDVERRANKEINQSHVHRIRRGDVTNPGIETLTVLAKGLGRPLHELMAASRGQDPKQLAHERLAQIEFAYEGMPARKKRRVDDFISMIEREIKRIESEPE